ncbi:mechanosensitive ion channel [Kiritimatiellaeota bacterium B1221]|nr:mechanosensitive ion channel [Kiritimatiellaeota bacterium B1221]
MDFIDTWLKPLNLSAEMLPLVKSILSGLILTLACILANLVTKLIILRLVHKAVKKSKVAWDNRLMERHVFTRLSHLVPGVLLYYGAHIFETDGFSGWLQRMAVAYILFAMAWSVHALLNGAQDIYRGVSFSASRPITGYVQTLQLLLWAATAVFAVASLLNRSPAGFLTGMGALSAVLMLVFKDSITGLVAGIQITANDMVRIGDWIEMPKYGADGDVIDITLHTVKVQNWDKTISTLPTHALIQDSFKNWRGMQESGGRRIKRSLMIDLQSVRFCDEALLEKMKGIASLKPYLDARLREVSEWNKEHQIDGSCPLNGRRLTNLGTFRAYVEAYLHEHPSIHQEGLTFLVRQLAPSEKGVAIEIYVFVNDIRWVKYEEIQGDIFDHLFAAISWFDLALYQAPAGRDVRVALSDT